MPIRPQINRKFARSPLLAALAASLLIPSRRIYGATLTGGRTLAHSPLVQALMGNGPKARTRFDEERIAEAKARRERRSAKRAENNRRTELGKARAMIVQCGPGQCTYLAHNSEQGTWHAFISTVPTVTA